MMKTSGGKRGAARKGAGAGKASKERRMVVTDQEPLRRQAATECNRELDRLENLRAEWKRYEEEERPAYLAWMAATFGPVLSEIRENIAVLREKDALIYEVEMEKMFEGARSYRAAYVAVMERRNNPPPPVDRSRWNEPPPPPSPGEEPPPLRPTFGKELPPEEQEQLFADYLELFLGINPKGMSQDRYDKMFAEFSENVLGQKAPIRPREQAKEAKPVVSRIKELYRLLVRRLHPDTLEGDDAKASSLWHEVQEAYADEDLERLEMLVALTDIQSKAVGSHTSLSQMRAVIASLRESIRALKRSLQEVREDPAWNFSRANRPALRARVKRDLEAQLDEQRLTLREMDVLLTRWSLPPKPKKPRRR